MSSSRGEGVRRCSVAFGRLVVLAALVSFVGCERGCLSSWLVERGVGTGGGGAPSDVLGLEGTDCSGGLARCEDGVVMASRTARVPASCAEGIAPEDREQACACPWEVALRCETGCAVPGLVAAVSVSDAAQLCRPRSPVLRDIAPGDPTSAAICAEPGLDCVDGVVRACEAAGRPARLLGACIHGCAVRVAVDPGDWAIADGAAVILCRRPPH